MKKTDLFSQTLTYEEFKALAERQPSLDGEWIYRLSFYIRHKDVSYPAFSICKSEYLFLSFEAAEKSIRDKLNRERKSEVEMELTVPYSFTIEQVAVGKILYHTGAKWLYDHKGNLIDYSITNWSDDVTEDFYQAGFFGRPYSRLRFKKGDIVEVFDDDSVSLAIVGADGPSVDRFWRQYDRRRGEKWGYLADASDDCYYLLNGPGYFYHNHVNSVAMMKPRFPVPEDIRRFFEYCLEHADNDECSDQYPVTTFFPKNFERYSETDLEITYDQELKCHRLVKKTSMSHYFHTSSPNQDEIDRLTAFLNDVQSGKTRLWFLIRDWNDNYRDEDEEPYLSPDTPLSELL